ncbi:endodeoxyribonuclease RusA [Desulfurobacterium thermolithotrophum DSM 11699]|uniref:Endodeoxyribonuclease RusA n=1 Tax=Desulfurobacterium thermolithotrophum (strain DSM 11699 / BSA) TaxID=868864 RepID=F0S3Y7_DESTD|nr:RusA family crossover junction endodeoxyribonuclease [Desulfurobacterium thermolithotrophum]ADY73559.1 endodeoxyribonuclease RusA [Desulfurobacterium thermolithotrophum DSM 11699]
MKFKFFFVGKIPSKANYKKISHRRINGEMKPFIINNPQVISSQKEAIYQFHLQKLSYGIDKFPIEKPVKVSVSFLFSKRVKQRDIDNAEKFVGDVLEKAGVLKRDSLIYVKEKVEKRLGVKGFDEIVIIEIEELDEKKRKEHEKEVEKLPEELLEFLKKLKLELPDESRVRCKSSD